MGTFRGRRFGLIISAAALALATPLVTYADTPSQRSAAGEAALPGIIPASRWGVIGRNTLGSPSAVLREGPYGRTEATAFAATQPPPYGRGSLGIIVGSGTEKIAWGNETLYADKPLSSIKKLKYWVFAGMDSLTGVSLPNITIEADPNVGSAEYTSLVYLPNTSTSPSAPSEPRPNVWQQYDASADNGKWWATGSTGGTITCTQASPCSFRQLKEKLPQAVISLSLGISKGRDNAFVGAVDGLQVNHTVYDFEFNGVRTRSVR
ncbi:hypothetical protein ACFFR3_42365 [Nonomuraea salmonea]|uniref:Uncharacterized protein n=1 Tax=Nonomuraea salmonea TaxID=46181 RepID=A0ABV5P154_9ACTN